MNKLISGQEKGIDKGDATNLAQLTSGIENIKALVAHPGLALTNLQVTTAKDGGMDGESDFMNNAQTAEDGATGIIRAIMDPQATSGDFYGPVAGWKGYPDLLDPEELLTDPSNLKINWEGCEKAVGSFKIYDTHY